MVVKARMEIAQLAVDALKFVFPAYCANAVPVLAGGGLRLDFGEIFRMEDQFSERIRLFVVSFLG